MIRAKFKCVSAAEDGCENEVVRLEAVTDDCEENKSWSKYTPGGDLTLWINNPPAKGKLEPGKEYFLDITPAEEG